MFAGDESRVHRHPRGSVGATEGVAPRAPSASQGRAAVERRPPRDERYRLPAKDRLPMGRLEGVLCEKSIERTGREIAMFEGGREGLTMRGCEAYSALR